MRSMSSGEFSSRAAHLSSAASQLLRGTGSQLFQREQVRSWGGPGERHLVQQKRTDGNEPDQHGETESSIAKELERQVDVHAFKPSDLNAVAGSVGFEQIRVSGEELLANAFGWFARTLEAGARPDSVPDGWRKLAFRTYITLQRVDGAALEPVLPARLFYNLLLSAKKPRA